MTTSEPQLPTHLQELQTPCLLLIDTRFRSNLARMAKHCEASNFALRPHAKTHKSGSIAKAQIDHGAIGICCATISEAEHLADSVNSILITSPLALHRHVERISALRERVAELICVVDSPAMIPHFEKTFDATRPLDVLVDLDPDMHRTGIEIGVKAFALARSLYESPSFNFRGAQCYAGNIMHVESIGQRTRRSHELWERVATFKRQLENQRIPCPIVTGGGTGTFDIDWQAGVATELQAGSYPFMDLEYMNIEWDHEGNLPFEPSLFVLTTVVSANTPGNVTTDAGLKAFSTDSVRPKIHAGIEKEATYVFKGDEHGGLVFEDATESIAIGTQMLITPPHCDPTINLYDHFTLVNEDLQILDTLSIDARSGRLYRGV
ncbi:MAG: alanine racemase [Gammaproteobacteria bacterium]|nr:alanine racemase [Gammaproteobacteria bacterium]